MKIKLIITNKDGLVVSQEILSEWNIQKDGIKFFMKLNAYLNQYIYEYNKANTIHIQSLEAFDENEVLLTSFIKN
jgi:hypothetical protein